MGVPQFKELAALSFAAQEAETKRKAAERVAISTRDEFRKAVQLFASGKSQGTVYYYRINSLSFKLQYSEITGWDLIPIDVTVLE